MKGVDNKSFTIQQVGAMIGDGSHPGFHNAMMKGGFVSVVSDELKTKSTREVMIGTNLASLIRKVNECG
jgi:hypothetical protein